jgi:hypothetical protein
LISSSARAWSDSFCDVIGGDFTDRSHARVANSTAKTSRKKASQRGGAATSYANWKVPQLRRRAKQAGTKGRSTMNKKQLIKALRTS